MSQFDQIKPLPTPDNTNEAIKAEVKKLIVRILIDRLHQTVYPDEKNPSKLKAVADHSTPEIGWFVGENYTSTKLLESVPEFISQLAREKPSPIAGLDAKQLEDLMISIIKQNDGALLRKNVINIATDERNDRKGVVYE